MDNVSTTPLNQSTTVIQPPNTTQSVKYASFWRRLAANSFDSLILIAINIGIYMTFASADATSMSTIVSILASFAYCALFWIRYNGQTPGKRLLHIKIVRSNGANMDWTTSFIRYISYIVSAIPLYLGNLWVIFDGKKQAWHDKIAQTYVVESDDKKPNLLVRIIGIFLPLFWIILIFIIIAAAFFVGLSSAVQKDGGNMSMFLDKDVQNAISASVKCGLSCSDNNDPKACRQQCTQTYINSQKNSKEVKQKVNQLVGNERHDWLDEMKPEAKKLYEEQIKLKEELDKLPYDETKKQEYMTQVKSLTDRRIELLKKATELDPTNALLWNWYGLAYTWQNSGSFEDGITYVKKAAELDPKNGFYTTDIGYMYYMNEDYDEAVIQFKKGLRINDNNALGHANLGRTYVALKLYDEARKEYEKSIAIYTKVNKDGSYDESILDIQKEMRTLK